MARVPGTTHLFFKFQSAVSRRLEVVTAAFPTTPWLFFYRNAVEVWHSKVVDVVTHIASLL